MAKNIADNIIEQLEAKELIPVFHFDFTEGLNIHRYCDLDVPLVVGPDITFAPISFSIQDITYSLGNVVDQARITIDNVDQIMTSIFVGGVIQGEEANIYLSVLDINHDIIGTINLFKGEIDSWSLNEKKIQITITSLFSRWAQKTTALHPISCRWNIFKGAECQYAGTETWCDRSYGRCLELNNIQHYGGFRFLPDFESREIFWGPRQHE